MLNPFNTFRGLSPFDPRFYRELDEMAGVCASVQAGGQRMALAEVPSKEVVIMRLTNNLGGGEYEFTEMMPGAGGGWANKAVGAAGRSGRCYEANLNARVRVPSVQIGTVKYGTGGAPFYRFENCCQTAPGSGSGSDDPTTTDDGIAERTFLVDWKCIGNDGCMFPVLVKDRLRFEAGQEVARLLYTDVEILWECGFLPCPHSGPPGGSGGMGPSGAELLDVWRLCGVDGALAYPQPGDILLSPVIMGILGEDFAYPVVQIDGVGPCYNFINQYSAGAPILDNLDIKDGCEDVDCDTGCFPGCEVASSTFATVAGGTGFCTTANGTYDYGNTYSDAGLYHLWTWTMDAGPSGFNVLNIRCDKVTGEVAAKIDTGTSSAWGGSDSIWLAFKVISGLVACDGGNLAGIFELNGLPLACAGQTVTVTL